MAVSRRDFLQRSTAASLAAAAMTRLSSAAAQPAQGIRTVETPVLEIAYEEHGDPDGTAIMLLHGFPYDVRSFDDVVGPLAAAGYRVLVPWLRGYGPTHFRDPAYPRMAEQAALAQDLIDFADALGIERFAAAGFDWGNRAACCAAVLHRDRFIAMAAVGGYTVQNTVEPGGVMPARLASMFWYMWYFNTDAGERALRANRHDLVRYLWDTWSPEWTYSDDDYARSAASFDNPDFVDIVVHSYRHRQLNAPGEARFLDDERRLAARPVIDIPAIVLRPGASGLGGRPSPDPSADQRQFSNLVARRIVQGAGHDLPRHRPDALADALLELLA
ncbi:MAG: alpha/beta hydrolase [Gammaproteobacteria bacterium]|jgi:pimeloyl-ACP methyl ester carboxylesterase